MPPTIGAAMRFMTLSPVPSDSITIIVSATFLKLK
jgi:hypothetical protein